MNLRCLRCSGILVTQLLWTGTATFGQAITMEQTLEYIHGKLGPSIEIEVTSGYLVAKFYEDDKIIREDQVRCSDLAIESMQYDKENRLFSIDCANQKNCVDRQLVVRRIDRQYGRISFPVSLDDKSINGLKNAFGHMIRLVVNPKYKSEIPFEQ